MTARRLLAALLVLLALSVSSSAEMGVAATGRTHVLTAATTNSQVICAKQCIIYGIVAVNTGATINHLKLYDQTGAPACNSDPVTYTLPIPFGASSSGNGFVIPLTVAFKNGLGICVTGGIADADNTAAATGTAINFLFQ